MLSQSIRDVSRLLEYLEANGGELSATSRIRLIEIMRDWEVKAVELEAGARPSLQTYRADLRLVAGTDVTPEKEVADVARID